MQKKSISATAAMLLIIAVSFTCTASAQTRVPGLSVGDSLKYTFDFNMNVSDSSFVPPSLFEGLMEQVENIDSVQVTITQISGSVVTTQTVMQFKNGTQQSDTVAFDVASGEDSTQEGSIGVFLIAADLNAGDKIYTSGSSGTINETITKTYPSGNRQINHQNIVFNYDVSQEELQDAGIIGELQQSNTQDTYWDKQTGALVEMSFNMVTRSSVINADIALHVQLVESNVFTIPEFPATAIFIVLTLAVTAFVVAIRYKQVNARNSSFSFNP